jgi:cobalt-zinc-cadmium efflux system outer membrane protein
MSFRSAACLVAFLCGVGVACRVVAAEPLAFEEAARKTLATNPDTQRFALELEASRARLDAAGLRPPTEIAADLDNFAGTGDTRGIHSAELTLSLNSVFERGGKRSARIAAAERSLDLLTLEQRITALDLVAETGRRFVAVAVSQERIGLAQATRAQADTTLALIRPRVEAARSPRTELLYAEIERSRADVEVDTAEHALAAAQAALAAQWGSPEERPNVSLATYDLPEPAAWAQLRSRLDALPDLERFASEQRLRQAQVALARAQAVPDWQWRIGVRRLQETNELTRDQALVAGIVIPLGQARRAAPGVRESEAELAEVGSSTQSRRLNLDRLLIGEFEQLQTARARLRAITDVQLPRAREARDLTEHGYRIGRFPYRELALAQQQVLELELARLEAASQFHLTRIEVERLTGAQLDLLKE